VEGAAMPKVVKKIESWGKRKGISGKVSDILLTAVKKKMSFSEIAESAGCSPQALRYQLRKIGVNSFKQKFEERVKELGYSNVREFFTNKDNVYKSMKELSQVTGFCYPTVSKYYHKFVAEAKSSMENK
jgi:DNA-binding Lrp family transcriptional regulator